MVNRKQIFFVLLFFISGSFLVFGQQNPPLAFPPTLLTGADFDQASKGAYENMNDDERKRVDACFVKANITASKCFADSNDKVAECYQRGVGSINEQEQECINKVKNQIMPSRLPTKEQIERMQGCVDKANKERGELFDQCKRLEQSTLDQCKEKVRQEVIDCVDPIVAKSRERIANEKKNGATCRLLVGSLVDWAKTKKPDNYKGSDLRQCDVDLVKACPSLKGIREKDPESVVRQCINSSPEDPCSVKDFKEWERCNQKELKNLTMADRKQNMDVERDRCTTQGNKLKSMCAESGLKVARGVADQTRCESEADVALNQCMTCANAGGQRCAEQYLLQLMNKESRRKSNASNYQVCKVNASSLESFCRTQQLDDFRCKAESNLAQKGCERCLDNGYDLQYCLDRYIASRQKGIERLGEESEKVTSVSNSGCAVISDLALRIACESIDSSLSCSMKDKEKMRQACSKAGIGIIGAIDDKRRQCQRLRDAVDLGRIGLSIDTTNLRGRTYNLCLADLRRLEFQMASIEAKCGLYNKKCVADFSVSSDTISSQANNCVDLRNRQVACVQKLTDLKARDPANCSAILQRLGNTFVTSECTDYFKQVYDKEIECGTIKVQLRSQECG